MRNQISAQVYMGSSIKKYWLLSTIVYLISQLVDAYLGDPYMHLELGLIFVNLVVPFGYLLAEILNFSGLYFFSYTKNGTALLTLNMGLAILRASLVALPFWKWNEISSHYANHSNKHLLLDAFISCLYFLIIVQWIVLSFMCRKENKLMQMNERSADPECQRMIQELNAVDDLDELFHKYGESVRTYPQFANIFKKTYQQRQVELKQGN